MKKNDWVKILFCIACALFFFAGRFTAPKPDMSNYTKTVDSLHKVVNLSRRLQNYYSEKANTAYNKGVEAQKAKVVVRTIYINDRARNRALSHSEKDSVIKHRFGVEIGDSSRFSRPVADSVLDVVAKNRMLEANQDLDSATIVAFASTKAHLESALLSCNNEGKAKDDLLDAKDLALNKSNKEVRKQKGLKWFFAALTGLLATLSVAR